MAARRVERRRLCRVTRTTAGELSVGCGYRASQVELDRWTELRNFLPVCAMMTPVIDLTRTPAPEAQE